MELRRMMTRFLLFHQAQDTTASMPPPKTAPCVVLIHGTFAPQAKWAQIDGGLATELRCRLGQDAKIIPHEWTALNTHRARIDAANGLRVFLEAFAYDNPATPIALVAHSHGGNVALWALTDNPALRRNVVAVCTLSAPFVRARFLPNVFGRYTLFDIIERTSSIATAVVAVAAMLAGATLGWSAGAFGVVLWLPGAIAGAWLTVVLFRPVATLADRFRKILNDEAEWAVNVLRYKIDPVPLWVYRVRFDEAGWLLRLWDTLTWLVRDAMTWPLASGWVGLGTVAAALLAAIAAGYEAQAFLIGLGLMVVGPFMITAAVLAGGFVAALWRRTQSAYGERALTTMSAMVTTVSLPKELKPFDRRPGVIGGVLRHSSPTQDPKVWVEIGKIVEAAAESWSVPPIRVGRAILRREEFWPRVGAPTFGSVATVGASFAVSVIAGMVVLYVYLKLMAVW